MTNAAKLYTNPPNEWRRETPGCQGWSRSPRPGSARKYFMVSADTHITPPSKLIAQRIDAKYSDRLPRVERRDDGSMIMHIEGARPARIIDAELEGEDAYRVKAGEVHGENATADLEERFADLDRDGVDAEVVFPNGAAIGAFWTPDPQFAQAQLRIYNDWAAEISAPYQTRMHIAACIATGDVETAIGEIVRVANLGFKVLTLPTHPKPSSTGVEARYNHAEYDRLWAAVQDADLTITFHVATAGDPRTARGAGGAVINRALSHHTVVDPIVALCASGICDRYPKLRFVAVEGGIGWIPALLDLMDETYKKHHMWVRPKLQHGLPSDYFRAQGGATFQEDRAGLILVEPYNLGDNFCWGNDYPHQEGTFPHSAAAIEREMQDVRESTRAKMLGLNAARLFKFDVLERLES